jgi:hypothetical protein
MAYIPLPQKLRVESPKLELAFLTSEREYADTWDR